MDFSGFDRENWRERTGPEHKRLASDLQKNLTKSDRDAAERASGCRYSVLLELSYFDTPRMLIIHPMHNMFLGSAKHFVKSILIGKQILSDAQFDILQHRVDSITAPPDIGRIPQKIRSGFASFTADQWKNWVLYFSLFVLHDLLDSDVLECWRHFVQACRVITAKHILLEEVQLSDAHLKQVCMRMQRLFERQSITPNMHMHCHLRSCIFDFGPLHGFWLYPFERYNGLLGAMPQNNHCIEVQIMSRFLRDNEVFGTYLPEEFSGDFLSLFPKQNQTVGSLADTLVYTEQSGSVIWAINSPGLSVDLPTHYSHLVFDQTELDTLTILYSKLYKVPASAVVLSSVIHKYSSATINNKRFGTHKTRTSSSSLAMAIWDNELFGLSPTMPTTPAAAS